MKAAAKLFTQKAAAIICQFVLANGLKNTGFRQSSRKPESFGASRGNPL
jgi:hypothetical protein